MMALQLLVFIFLLLVSLVGTEQFTMENQFIRAVVDHGGRVTSLVELKTGREAIAPGASGNVFMMYEDIPLYWDAWYFQPFLIAKGCRGLPPGEGMGSTAWNRPNQGIWSPAMCPGINC